MDCYTNIKIKQLVIEANSPQCLSPQSGGNSSSGVPHKSSGDGGYASPGSARSQPDWSIVDQLFDSPHLIHTMLTGKCSKDVKELVKSAGEDVKYLFSKQVFEILVQVVKTSLALVRRRFVGSKSFKGTSVFASGDSTVN